MGRLLALIVGMVAVAGLLVWFIMRGGPLYEDPERLEAYLITKVPEINLQLCKDRYNLTPTLTDYRFVTMGGTTRLLAIMSCDNLEQLIVLDSVNPEVPRFLQGLRGDGFSSQIADVTDLDGDGSPEVVIARIHPTFATTEAVTYNVLTCQQGQFDYFRWQWGARSWIGSHTFFTEDRTADGVPELVILDGLAPRNTRAGARSFLIHTFDGTKLTWIETIPAAGESRGIRLPYAPSTP